MTQEPLSALDQQVGGQHYKKGIQPFALSMANGHDGCIHAITKYMTRHRRKDPAKGYEDCQKAHHITGIRLELIKVYGLPRAPSAPQIMIRDYVKSNELCLTDAAAIYAIEAWNERSNVDHEKWHDGVRQYIRAAARYAYPETFNEEDFV